MQNIGARYDLTIAQGFDWAFQFTWKDSNNTPIDVTGFTFKLQAKVLGSQTLVIDIDQTNGITLGGITGVITCSLSDTATALLDFQTASYYIEYESGGVKKRLMYGYITLVKDIAP